MSVKIKSAIEGKNDTIATLRAECEQLKRDLEGWKAAAEIAHAAKEKAEEEANGHKHLWLNTERRIEEMMDHREAARVERDEVLSSLSRAQAQNERMREALRALRSAIGGVRNQHLAREFLDARDIYHCDLDWEGLLFAVARAALSETEPTK